jgi:pantoate--beta-alanine ligase
MNIVKTKTALREKLDEFRAQGHKIAFVPTMGALHEGHLSLLNKAATLADKVVCSIFVNPTQFNDPEDLKKYPRPIEKDIALLESVGCDVLFLPEVEEMYPAKGEVEGDWEIDLGVLDQVLEGKERPGHFKGVVQIVYKLFKAVHPDVAVFGQKDLQQVLVIESLIRQKQLLIQLVMEPTKREQNGLAMSSRNIRLSETGKQQALALSQTLARTKTRIAEWQKGNGTLAEIRDKAVEELHAASGVTLEYFALCDRKTLLDATENTPAKDLVGLVAAWVEGVRLIDNSILDPEA